MKNLLFAIMCIFSMFFYSCSNNEEIMPESVTSVSNTRSIGQEDVIIVNSFEEVYEKANLPKSDIQYYVNPLITSRISVTDYVAYGYDSKSVFHTTKMGFSKEFAEKHGLQPYTVYIVQFYNVYKDVQRALNSTFINDEECETVGCIPTTVVNALGARGYASMKKNESTQTLQCQCFCIAYNAIGQQLDFWHPLKPDNFKWTYSCLQR